MSTNAPIEWPPTLKFAFVADSSDADKRSGTATWQIPVRIWGGPWKMEPLTLRFETFSEAYRTNALLQAIWVAGKRSGLADAQSKLSATLKSLQD